MDYLVQHIESLIFSADAPITFKEIKSTLEEAFGVKFHKKELEWIIGYQLLSIIPSLFIHLYVIHSNDQNYHSSIGFAVCLLYVLIVVRAQDILLWRHNREPSWGYRELIPVIAIKNGPGGNIHQCIPDFHIITL